MTFLSLRKRVFIGLTAIALGFGGSLEIASAATSSASRNLEGLTSTELTEGAAPLNTAISRQQSDLVAAKFKFKRHGRKFKKHHGHKVKKHHGRKIKKQHGRHGIVFKKY